MTFAILVLMLTVAPASIASANMFDGFYIGVGGLEATTESRDKLALSRHINSIQFGKTFKKNVEVQLRYVYLGTQTGEVVNTLIQDPVSGQVVRREIRMPDTDFQSVDLITRFNYRRKRYFGFWQFGATEANTVTYSHEELVEFDELSEVSYGVNYGVGGGIEITDAISTSLEFTGYSPLNKRAPDYRNLFMLSISYIFSE